MVTGAVMRLRLSSNGSMNLALLYKMIRTSISGVTIAFPVRHDQEQRNKSIDERDRPHATLAYPRIASILEIVAQCDPRSNALQSCGGRFGPVSYANPARLPMCRLQS